jgi:DNA-binding CsgD family transcriptional regulator
MVTATMSVVLFSGPSFSLCETAGVAHPELSAAGLRPLRHAQRDTLTAHERLVADMTAQGHPAAVVAKQLRITEQGVKRLLSSVYRKIGTDNTGLARDLTALSRL